MAWLELVSWETKGYIKGGHYLSWPRTTPQEASKANDAMDAVLDLEEVSFIARKEGIDILSSSTGSQVTPTLAYIHECVSRSLCPVTIDELFSIPGQTIPDVLSTFQQHGYLLNMYYNEYALTWQMELTNLDDNWPPSYDTDFLSEKGWRTWGKWKQQRISLEYQYLKISLNKVYNEHNQYW